MRKFISVFAAAGLAAVSGAVWAGNCPNEIAAIDKKLASKPALSKADADKVAQLRAKADADHKAGKHGDSMKAAGEAKKILGI
jgi:hypothetical protein